MRSILRFPRGGIITQLGARGEGDQRRHPGVEEGAEVVAEAGDVVEEGDLYQLRLCTMIMKVKTRTLQA